jgi:hemolysin activation/secretion protein
MSGDSRFPAARVMWMLTGQGGCMFRATMRGTSGRLALTTIIMLAAGASVSLAQLVPGTRPEQTPPGQPQTPRPDFAMPQPNRDAAKPAGNASDSPDPEAPTYLVGAVIIRYAVDHPSLPAIDDLMKQEVILGRTDAGYVSPGGGVEEVVTTIEDIALAPPQRWSSRALFEISKSILAKMNEEGVVGVTISPIEGEFAPGDPGDPEWGKDLRRPGQSSITLLVRTGFVTEMRTIASGNRIPEDRRINAEEHQRIIDNAPVQVYSPDDADRADVLRKDELDDYVFRLNRHPGRRVDVSIAAGQENGGLALDFLVSENKPWSIYIQGSNTGTENTSEWRERFGFVNNQLTGHDDILSIDYVTAGFDKSHLLSGSYEFGAFESWLRARIFGSYSQYEASDVGQPDANFKGDSFSIGGELIANIFQRRELFIDLFTGVRFQRITTDSEFLGGTTEGEGDFLLPSVGARLERNTDMASTNASVSLEFSAADAVGTEDADVVRLGRTNGESEWTTFQWDFSHSMYIDRFLFGSRWLDTGPEGKPTLAHEIALAFRGQAAFDSRLPPNFQQVLGGLYSVRGYEESIVAGDTVVLGSAEYRFHLPQALGFEAQPGSLFGQSFRYKPQQPYGRADWDLILKGFVDAGRAISSKNTSFETDENLVGAGFGIEFQFKRNLTIRADFGWALESIENRVKSGDNRVHFVATLLF